MKEIKLTQGYVALVDDADYEWLNQWKWFAAEARNTFYANRNERVNGKQRTVRMHRIVIGLTDPKHICDHGDGNGLNNQRSNLRSCSHRQNVLNSGCKSSALTSGYKGVSLYAPNGKWLSRIMHNSKSVHLGYFNTEEDAAKAYNKAAVQYHGEFARLNIINQ